MKTPEQVKGAIRNIAASKGLKPQEVLQMFLFERILDRLSVSKYRDNFILKGGLLISSMIGIHERTTMDMDTTVRGLPMEETVLIQIVQEIISLDVEDGIQFVYEGITPIRENDEYHNFRIHLSAKYGKINSPMKIDVTTGDVITPAAVRYEYPLIFENRFIPVMAYTLETVLAEKYETIIRRNIGTTRARDFYDIHILYRTRYKELRPDILRSAVAHTVQKRGSEQDMRDWKEIVKDIRAEQNLACLWEKYCEDNPYAKGISFDQVVDTVNEIAILLNF